jgi:hypothetical protein
VHFKVRFDFDKQSIQLLAMSDKEILQSFFEKLKEQVIANHIAAGQKATGKTINSFQIEIDEASGRLTARGGIDSLEKGTPKGSRVSLDSLIEWANAKGIQVKNISSFAFLVQRKIMKEGSKLFRNGGRTDIISSVLTDGRVGALEKQIADKYFNLVKSEVKESFI